MRPAAAQLCRGVEKNLLILFNVFDYNEGVI